MTMDEGGNEGERERERQGKLAKELGCLKQDRGQEKKMMERETNGSINKYRTKRQERGEGWNKARWIKIEREAIEGELKEKGL